MKMDAQAYKDAVEQRLALRRELKRRLTELRGAGASLGSAAGNSAPGIPTLEIAADPIAQIEGQVAEASSLAQQIKAHDARTRAAEQALSAAKEKAKRLVRTVVILAVLLVGIVALVLVFGSH